jgi:DNA-binding winged helix-turn-helix (wHTH) protein
VRIAFGEYAADFSARALARGGVRVHLSPKAFRLLELLISHRPRALSKGELQEALWPDVFVQESNLADLVSELRSALDQSGQRSGTIRTVHGFGYSFAAAAVETDGASTRNVAPSWRISGPAGSTMLGEGEFIIGRDPSAAVPVDEDTVSWTHARLTVSGTGADARARLEDLSSRNGTYLNGRRLDGPTEVHDGDELRVGSVVRAFWRISREKSPTRPMNADDAR